MEQDFFPKRPEINPTIYAYQLPGVASHKGYLKIGYTERTAKVRIDEQLHTSKISYEIMLEEFAEQVIYSRNIDHAKKQNYKALMNVGIVDTP